jgi:hypothetical protein
MMRSARNDAARSNVDTRTMKLSLLASAIVVGIAMSVGCGGSAPSGAVPPQSASAAPHRFELRVVASETGERIPSWDGGEVPVGAERLNLDDAVEETHLVRDPERGGAALSVGLRDDARPKLARFTSDHVGDRVAFVVGGRAAATLTVRDPVVGASLLLTAPNDADVLEMQRRLVGN